MITDLRLAQTKIILLKINFAQYRIRLLLDML